MYLVTLSEEEFNRRGKGDEAGKGSVGGIWASLHVRHSHGKMRPL
jgi:hypothetical protein